MPELPEVETIVRQLNKKVVGRKVIDAWTDWPKAIKTHTLEKFISAIRGRNILHARRRAKYILMDLSGGKTLVIHQKISGHLLYGKWVRQNQEPPKETNQSGFTARARIKNQNSKSKLKKIDSKAKQLWVSAIPGPLRNDRNNQFIRFILFLDNGWQLALSDLRRFAKVYLVDTDEVEKMTDIGKLGPEPLDKSFTFKKFRELVTKKRGVIKKVLMDQFIIAGIGNIYSDEILWYAGIHPLHRVEKLNDKELAAIYKYIRLVLKKAIRAKGSSQEDYRTLEGKFGKYQNMQKAYQQTGKECQKSDGGIIKRIKINGRSAHFCPVHQK
jgi:formamidopyrimidine-DNA glycosylase